jgi:L-asparagine oxygenase
MPTITGHRPPLAVPAGDWAPIVPAWELDDEHFVTEAGDASRFLPAAVHEALIRFGDRADPSGALLLRGAPLGHVPPTPAVPAGATSGDLVSELTLLTVARRLGQPVGYLPEHGGRIVQNIVPTRAEADRQVSTSSKVTLMFHTETAFHPHRPRYLLLLCLRGDPHAGTTLASIHELLPRLDADVIECLLQPRFRTAVDASFLGGRPNRLGPPRPVLEGTMAEPTFVFDADLMVGIDDESTRAVRLVADAIDACHATVVLEAGDLLVVDNHLAVHGRTPYTPRFDGTDRWLQRSFVVADLSPSAAERTGRVITTSFGGG